MSPDSNKEPETVINEQSQTGTLSNKNLELTKSIKGTSKKKKKNLNSKSTKTSKAGSSLKKPSDNNIGGEK